MLWPMCSKTRHPLGPHPSVYAKLLARLAHSDWFCQGTVVSRSLRRKMGGKWVDKGPYYLWTGKRQGKTVCHALSHEQYAVAKKAIDENRKVMATMAKLQTMTLETILQKIPGVDKRK
jgi:hypothetical protein